MIETKKENCCNESLDTKIVAQSEGERMTPKRLLKVFEEHSSTCIFILTSLATILGIIIKALEKVYQYARYKELCIPTYFLNQGVLASDFFPFLFMTISIIVCTAVLVLAISHFRQIKAYLKFEKKLQISFKRKLEHIAIRFIYPIVGLATISTINYPSVYLYNDSKSKFVLLISFLLVFLTEFFIAKEILKFMNDYKKAQEDSNNIKIEKPTAMTDEEFSEIKEEYIKSAGIVNFKTLLSIISILLIIVMFFYMSSSAGQLSTRSGSQQILKDGENVSVVLEIYDGKYIVSPVSITDDGTMTIYNKNQTLLDSEGLDYTYVFCNKVVLETDTP